MGFNWDLIRYRGKPITVRYDNIKAPNLKPQIRIQYLDEYKSGAYGPYQMIFDLYNERNPEKSRPLAFANMDFEHVLQLIQELFKAVLVAYPQYDPNSLARLVARRVHPWWVNNIHRIEVGEKVEG